MDPRHMLQTAVVLFAIAALGGVVMAGIRFAGRRNPPTSLAMVHGLLGGAGLTLVLYAACTAGVPSTALLGVALLLVAALGGILLNLNYQWKQRPLPGGVVVGHALLAVVGFSLMCVAAFA